MRITAIQDFHASAGWRDFSFLKVTTDEGLVGWSEYNEDFGSGGVSNIIRRFAGTVVGMDPREVGKITLSLQAISRMASGGLHHEAAAAIENACLDVKAKAAGVPVYALFGGPFRERVPLYWSHCGTFRAVRPEVFEAEFGREPVRDLDGIRRMGREAVARGFKALKTNPLLFDGEVPRMVQAGLRLGPGLFERSPEAYIINAAVDQAAAFREAIGPDTGLMIDLNFGQRTEGYLRLARALRPFDLTWLEMDIMDPDALALIRRTADVPIASLETLHGLGAFRPYLAAYAADVAIVDVLWNGLWESVRIAALAEAFETSVAPHNFCGPLSDLISAHFAAAVPNFRIMEYEADDAPWRDDFLTAPAKVEAGELLLTDAPGWGTEVDEDALAEHPPRGKKALT